MRFHAVVVTITIATLLAPSLPGSELFAADSFDQRYRAYAELLSAHVVDTRVDYARLKSNRVALDTVAMGFANVTAVQLKIWSAEEQIAFWINAYNVFTLQAIVNHYPIVWRWRNLLTLTPWNSVRQIPGVWSSLRWEVWVFDVKTAFLSGQKTQREIYARPPREGLQRSRRTSCSRS